jgi:mannose-6-phosphate isomerase-like protein (cupin superfamily)
MGTLIKDFCSFKEPIDFNFLSNLLDRNNFETQFSSNWLNNYIFESVFKIQGIEKDNFFKEIFNLLNINYNKENKKSDLFIFFSLVSGNKSITHRDNYDVFIIGLYGKTIYKVENEYFTLEPNDLLIIPKNQLHKAIGLTPRISLSYGIY